MSEAAQIDSESFMLYNCKVWFSIDGFDVLAMGYRCLIHPTHWLNLTKNCIQMHFTTDFRL